MALLHRTNCHERPANPTIDGYTYVRYIRTEDMRKKTGSSVLILRLLFNILIYHSEWPKYIDICMLHTTLDLWICLIASPFQFSFSIISFSY